MNFRGRNKVTPEFNMSSMTDIVFLLLIFFMIASTLVTTNAIDILLPKATEEMTPDFLGRVFEDLLLRKSFDLVFITSVVGEMICIKGHNELIAIQTILNNQETIKIKSVFEELNDKTFFEIGYFNINKAIDTETYVQYFDPGVSLDFIKSRYDLSIPNEILDEFNKKENKTIFQYRNYQKYALKCLCQHHIHQ